MTPTSPPGRRPVRRSSSTSKCSTMVNAVTPRWGMSPRRSTNSPKTLNLVSTFRGELHPPKSKEIVSLPTLLTDLQANAQLITRTHQRRRYKKAMKHLPERIYIDVADKIHDAVSNGEEVLQADSVKKDLKLIERTV